MSRDEPTPLGVPVGDASRLLFVDLNGRESRIIAADRDDWISQARDRLARGWRLVGFAS